VVQAIAHVVFFGAVLGWYLGWAHRKAEMVE
jgi:ABC-type Mn2+/Zn2+ transport system permease subunit